MRGVLTAGLALAFASVLAMPSTAAPTSRVMRVDLSGSATQSLALPKGKSAIVELPVDARDVLVTSPAVADVVLRNPRRISVLGVAPGQTDAVFFDATGRRILSLEIRVDQDGAALSETIKRVLPTSQVQVETINDSVILTGQVSNILQSDQVAQIAAHYVSKPENVMNLLAIAGKDQVMLKMRIVEVQRNIIKQLGFNLSAVLNQVGQPQYLLGSAASFAVNGNVVGGLNGGYSMNTTSQPQSYVVNPATGVKTDIEIRDRNNPLSAVKTGTAGKTGLNQADAKIQAFERVGLLRTLAEPSVTAISGEAANFLAGGEFPVPTGLDQSGRVSVEFKSFGVGLGFTPVVLSGGRISLKLSTEVSELSSEGAFKLGEGTAAVTVPALTVRRAQTTVELPSGGSMMIAGLIMEKTRQNLDSIPGAMNLPILGSLFRSRDFLSGQTELVIIITPYIVDPSRPDALQTPADGLLTATDAQTILLGRLNRAVKAKPGANATRSYQGPVGYVIE